MRRYFVMETELTEMLQASIGRDNLASEELLPLVYDELRRLAMHRISRESPGQTLQATALVHEAWIRLAGQKPVTWNDRAHFFRTAAQTMRRILVDRARQRASLKRGQASDAVDVSRLELEASVPNDRVLLVNEMMAVLECEDPESAEVITLKFFGGLTNREIAEIRGVTERTAERQWAYAKASLYRIIQEAT